MGNHGDKQILKEADISLLGGMPEVFLQWFSSNARDLPWRRVKDPYRVWLSEIMLQQTRVEAVKGYYHRFVETLPNLHALAEASEEVVFKLWEGLGYYRRARHLHQAARGIVRDRGGIFPSTYDGILALPGVGAYTAGAIASICFGEPKPAVDGNVLRVVARIMNSEAPIDQPHFKRELSQALEDIMRQSFRHLGDGDARGAGGSNGDAQGAGGRNGDARAVGSSDARGAVSSNGDARAAGGSDAQGAGSGGMLLGDDPGSFNQSLMEVGATICLPKGMPKCALCPARLFCRGHLSGRAEQLPVRTVKKARRVERKTVFILWKGALGQGEGGTPRLALRRRGALGLLAGLWELPNVEGWLGADEAITQAVAWGAKPQALEQVLERRHIFTHVEWHMRGYVIHCSEDGSSVRQEAGLPLGGRGELGFGYGDAAGTVPDDAERDAADAAGRPARDGILPPGQAMIWASEEERKQAFPLPSAFRIFLP